MSLRASPPNLCLAQAAPGASAGGAVVRQGLPTHLLGPVPLPVVESKASSSHQALLQHLLQKEQIRQQRNISTGVVTWLWALFVY